VEQPGPLDARLVRKGTTVKRLFLAVTAVALHQPQFAPAAKAPQPIRGTHHVLVAVKPSVDIAAGDQLDTLVVVDGNAHVSGHVKTIFIASGTATLTGATADTLVVMNGTADLGAGTTITGDVRTFDGTVTQAVSATVGGSVRTLDTDFAALAVVLVPAFILLFIGLGIVGLAAALLVAAFGSRQVRDVEALIRREPGQVLVTGLVASIAIPVLSVLLMITIVGAPLGFALLFVLMPAILFLAWIVAAILVGDWIVAQWRGQPESGRPYRAALIGVVVLAIAGLVPFVSAIATLFGLGALLLAGGRMLRGGPRAIGAPDAATPAPSFG
jgi:hypothetical protein